MGRPDRIRDRLLGIAVTGAIAAFVGAGCSVDHTGLAQGYEFECEALVCNDAGHVERVSLSDPEFDGRRVFDYCDAHPGEETLWRAHLQDVLSVPTFRDHAGPWHLQSFSCELSAVFVDSPPICPTLGPERIDDCAEGVADCVVAAPEPLELAATILSESSPVATVRYENQCVEPQFVRADATVFDDAFMQFFVAANGCGPATDPRGFELAPFGSAGDGCSVDFRFEPRTPGLQDAMYRVPVEGRNMIVTTLRGEGVGTTPATIDGRVRYCIDPDPEDCGVASFGVVNEGPGGFRITAFDYEVIDDATGFTEPPTGPAIDTIFAPGAAALYRVEWCRSRATPLSERLQVSISTTTSSGDTTGEATRDFRFTIDAPATCP